MVRTVWDFPNPKHATIFTSQGFETKCFNSYMYTAVFVSGNYYTVFIWPLAVWLQWTSLPSLSDARRRAGKDGSTCSGKEKGTAVCRWYQTWVKAVMVWRRWPLCYMMIYPSRGRNGERVYNKREKADVVVTAERRSRKSQSCKWMGVIESCCIYGTCSIV